VSDLDNDSDTNEPLSRKPSIRRSQSTVSAGSDFAANGSHDEDDEEGSFVGSDSNDDRNISPFDGNATMETGTGEFEHNAPDALGATAEVYGATVDTDTSDFHIGNTTADMEDRYVSPADLPPLDIANAVVDSPVQRRRPNPIEFSDGANPLALSMSATLLPRQGDELPAPETYPDSPTLSQTQSPRHMDPPQMSTQPFNTDDDDDYDPMAEQESERRPTQQPPAMAKPAAPVSKPPVVSVANDADDDDYDPMAEQESERRPTQQPPAMAKPAAPVSKPPVVSAANDGDDDDDYDIMAEQESERRPTQQPPAMAKPAAPVSKPPVVSVANDADDDDYDPMAEQESERRPTQQPPAMAKPAAPVSKPPVVSVANDADDDDDYDPMAEQESERKTTQHVSAMTSKPTAMLSKQAQSKKVDDDFDPFLEEEEEEEDLATLRRKKSAEKDAKTAPVSSADGKAKPSAGKEYADEKQLAQAKAILDKIHQDRKSGRGGHRAEYPVYDLWRRKVGGETKGAAVSPKKVTAFGRTSSDSEIVPHIPTVIDKKDWGTFEFTHTDSNKRPVRSEGRVAAKRSGSPSATTGAAVAAERGSKRNGAISSQQSTMPTKSKAATITIDRTNNHSDVKGTNKLGKRVEHMQPWGSGIRKPLPTASASTSKALNQPELQNRPSSAPPKAHRVSDVTLKRRKAQEEKEQQEMEKKMRKMEAQAARRRVSADCVEGVEQDPISEEENDKTREARAKQEDDYDPVQEAKEEAKQQPRVSSGSSSSSRPAGRNPPRVGGDQASCSGETAPPSQVRSGAERDRLYALNRKIEALCSRHDESDAHVDKVHLNRYSYW
jgi:hypothetical protein